mmetsp:Transcript_111683/g.266422  ORF Transcript_111683/g.266422 Transcript_111683/m.266422 type:complete len:92 (-) Transcript_111683:229-504(-)
MVSSLLWVLSKMSTDFGRSSNGLIMYQVPTDGFRMKGVAEAADAEAAGGAAAAEGFFGAGASHVPTEGFRANLGADATGEAAGFGAGFGLG